MIKTQTLSVFGEIYTTGKKIYTAGGSDGSDKSHLCPKWINCKIDCRYELFLGFEPVVGFECRKGAEVCSCGERKRSPYITAITQLSAQIAKIVVRMKMIQQRCSLKFCK